MKIDTLAKWFIKQNPELRGGYTDQNTRLNKLLYFSHLMHYVVTGKLLTNCKFEKWDNGPVSREIYRAYKYGNLSQYSEDVKIEDESVLKFLKIINFLYSYKTASELSKETHEHSIWIMPQKNEVIDFSQIDEKEKNLMINLYENYGDLNFDNLVLEKINDNIYYYDKSNLNMTDEIVAFLEKIKFQNEPIFVENINGELVFS